LWSREFPWYAFVKARRRHASQRIVWRRTQGRQVDVIELLTDSEIGGGV
jgi:hypothetical protein